jgi:hypothetical protein
MHPEGKPINVTFLVWAYILKTKSKVF